MRRFERWLTRGWFSSSATRVPWLSSDSKRAPIEAIVMRCFGVAWLVLFLAGTSLSRPSPGLHGRGAAILLAMIALVAFALSTQPLSAGLRGRRRIGALVGVTAAAAVLAALQPHGPWQSGAIVTGIFDTLCLGRLGGALMLAFSLAVLMSVSVIENHGGAAVSVLFNAVPWFLVFRLMREIAYQRNALGASRAAEARAAAAAERGRLTREMHDVLAHSLSALALQLESTRLLAATRGVDPEVTRAIDQAHQLAAGGLQEARRAIATARGDDLPGP